MRVSDTFIALLLAATVSGVYVAIVTEFVGGLIVAIINIIMIVIFMLVFMFEIMNLAKRKR